jgi:hypothetical protein
MELTVWIARNSGTTDQERLLVTPHPPTARAVPGGGVVWIPQYPLLPFGWLSLAVELLGFEVTPGTTVKGRLTLQIVPERPVKAADKLGELAVLAGRAIRALEEAKRTGPAEAVESAQQTRDEHVQALETAVRSAYTERS